MEGIPGRNDPCRCGSGRKYKNCCLRLDEMRTKGAGPMPPEVQAQFREKIAREQGRREQYGDVRPIIHTDFQGYKFVAVGSELHWSKQWRLFTDFLLYYVKKVFGNEWGRAELKKLPAERHVVIQWYNAFCEFQARHPVGSDGLASGEPDGPSLAYLTLAYDLYLLGDHNALRKRFVERLKQPEEFQGARYELYVAVNMIRAGFSLQLEDERDGSRKHPEYLATHRGTGEVFAVEAKSRHLPGVLGRPGPPKSWFRLDIRQLLGRALAKAPAQPYIVFIDGNMPPKYVRESRDEWLADVHRAVELADRGLGESGAEQGSAFNLLVVTNVPHHYGEPGGNLPDPVFYRLVPARPGRPVAHPDVFLEIERALSQSYAIPQEFPKD